MRNVAAAVRLLPQLRPPVGRPPQPLSGQNKYQKEVSRTRGCSIRYPFKPSRLGSHSRPSAIRATAWSSGAPFSGNSSAKLVPPSESTRRDGPLSALALAGRSPEHPRRRALHPSSSTAAWAAPVSDSKNSSSKEPDVTTSIVDSANMTTTSM